MIEKELKWWGGNSKSFVSLIYSSLKLSLNGKIDEWIPHHSLTLITFRESLGINFNDHGMD